MALRLDRSRNAYMGGVAEQDYGCACGGDCCCEDDCDCDGDCDGESCSTDSHHHHEKHQKE